MQSYKIGFENGLSRYLLLVFVEVPTDPCHCDDEGEDCESNYDKYFIGHDFF